MKFTINKQDFVKKLETNNRAISGSVINEILKGLKLTVTKDEITIISSSSDLSIKTTTKKSELNNLQVEDEGEIVIANANYFTNIAKKLSGNIVEIETTNSNQIVISAGNATFTIPGRNSTNYPNLPEIVEEKTITLPTIQLIDTIHETIKSAAVKDGRPIFNGIHFVITSSQLKAVATDSHRLAQKVINIENGTDLDIVVPNRVLNEIRTISEQYPEARLVFEDRYFAVEFEDITIYSQLVEGEYPDTNRLIPSEISTKLQLDAKELLPVVERAALAASQAQTNVITFNLSDNKLLITTRQSEYGSFKEEVTIKTLSGDDLIISMNPEFVKDAINSLGEETVDMEFTGSLKPFVIRPQNETSNDRLQLLTPVRTIDN
jgi:DNA polymerase-3 subunit beta